MKEESFVESIGKAIESGSVNNIDKSINKAIESMSKSVLELSQKYDYLDRPIFIAVAEATLSAMKQALPNEGKELVKTIESRISTVVVDIDEIRRQRRNSHD